MEAFVVVAKITAHTDQAEQVAARIDALALPTRQETGCLRYEVYRDPDAVAVTLIYEVWASEESWRKHIATDHLQAFKTQVIDVSASMSVDKLRFDDGG